MDMTITRNQFLSVDRQVGPGEVGELSSGFPNDDRSGGHVPWVEAHLPKSIEASGCDVTEIQCR